MATTVLSSTAVVPLREQSRVLPLPTHVAALVAPPPTKKRRKRKRRPPPFTISQESMSMLMHIEAGRGSGKSTLAGGELLPYYLWNGISGLCIDPVGETIDNCLAVIDRIKEPAIREWAFRQIRLVDGAGLSGYVCPFPVLERRFGEEPADTADRLIQAFLKLDPALVNAPMQGANALTRCGLPVLQLLIGMGLPLTSATDLLAQPEAWDERIAAAARSNPILAEAAAYILSTYRSLKPNDRRIEALSFTTKISPFVYNSRMQAMFCAECPGFSWQDIVDQHQLVLVDLSGFRSASQKRFTLWWLYQSFVDWLLARGAGQHHKPVFLVMDEITTLLDEQTSETSLLGKDVTELVERISRNYRCLVTVIHQEANQLHKSIHDRFMTAGVQLLGVTNDRDSAIARAKRFYDYDPQWVRKSSLHWERSMLEFDEYIPVERTEEFTPEQQQLLNSNRFRTLGPGEFYVAVAWSQGTQATDLIKVSTTPTGRRRFPDKERCRQLRQQLLARDGRRIEHILMEIEERQNTGAKGGTQEARPSPAYAPTERW